MLLSVVATGKHELRYSVLRQQLKRHITDQWANQVAVLSPVSLLAIVAADAAATSAAVAATVVVAVVAVVAAAAVLPTL